MGILYHHLYFFYVNGKDHDKKNTAKKLDDLFLKNDQIKNSIIYVLYTNIRGFKETIKPKETENFSNDLPVEDFTSLIKYSSYQQEKEFQLAIDLLATGKLNPDPLITHQYPLDNVLKEFEAAAGREVYGSIKVLVLP